MTRALTLLLTSVVMLSSCAVATCGCVTEVRIFAAASLAKPLEDLSSGFESSYGPAVHITRSTGSSTALRTQIEQGARADVFLSADIENVQALFQAGLTDTDRVAFATNQLVIVVPRGNPADLFSPIDLARPGLKVIAAGEQVPINKYSEQLIANLAALPGYPVDFASGYQANVVSREDNVGAVVAKIELGEGDAAIVYASDARLAGVDTVAVPPAANVTATFAGVVLNDASGPKAAHAFLDWLRGPVSQQLLAAHGFSPAP